MAYTTNLNLYLPTRYDYVNVQKDLAENFQKIDDAFWWDDISDQLVFPAGIELKSGGVFKFNKLIVVQLRLQLTDPVAGSEYILISGLPTPKNLDNNTTPVTFQTNIDGVQSYWVLNEGGIKLYAASKTAPAGALIVNGVYVCE